MVVFPERIKRRVHLEEYLSVCRLGTARLQVVNQSLTDLAGQRQSQWCACLRSAMPGRVERAPVVVVLDERLDLAFEILTANDLELVTVTN